MFIGFEGMNSTLSAWPSSATAAGDLTNTKFQCTKVTSVPSSRNRKQSCSAQECPGLGLITEDDRGNTMRKLRNEKLAKVDCDSEGFFCFLLSEGCRCIF